MALTKVTYSMIDGAVANIVDFGASTSASGADNHAALVAAFASGAKSVFVPEGTFNVTGDTITIPDDVEFYGAGRYATTINFTPNGDKDCFVLGWYITMRDMKVIDAYASSGSYGTIRLQSLTNPEIPTNVGGNNWTDPAIGGLSYKNVLRNLVVQGGHNYNIYCVNVAYITIDNVRAVLSRNTSANLYIWGKGGVNMPVSTTVKVFGGEFTASFAGDGIKCENTSDSIFYGVIAEGNYGRGITLSACTNIKVEGGYVENNFALGAPTGDADVVYVNCDRAEFSNMFVLGNNSNDAFASGFATTNCSISSCKYVVLGGGTHTLDVDQGTVVSDNGTGIQSNGLDGATGGRWVRFADGTAIFSKKVSLTGVAINSATGSLFASAATADTAFPSAVFMSDGAGGYVFETAIHVLSSGGTAHIWPASTGSAVNNAIRYTLLSPVSIASVDVDVHITLTGRWK